ncbi:hypothetical protein GWL_43710 [Herbaspirillum sp. GW103]|nr:hypothetical protein GWL_43710 [Herbaspirillum sp. GW103]
MTSFSKNSLEDPHLQSDGQTLMLLAARDCTLVDRSDFLDGSERLKWQLLYFFIVNFHGALAIRLRDRLASRKKRRYLYRRFS